jgi:hypothetical protein
MQTGGKVRKKVHDNTLVEKFMEEKRLKETHKLKNNEKERTRLPQEFPPLPGPCCQAEAA